jgi:hypothetical protein
VLLFLNFNPPRKKNGVNIPMLHSGYLEGSFVHSFGPGPSSCRGCAGRRARRERGRGGSCGAGAGTCGEVMGWLVDPVAHGGDVF